MAKKKVEPVAPQAPPVARPELTDAQKLAVYANARRLKVLTSAEGKQLIDLLTKAGVKHFQNPLGYGVHFKVEHLEIVSEA